PAANSSAPQLDPPDRSREAEASDRSAARRPARPLLMRVRDRAGSARSGRSRSTYSYANPRSADVRDRAVDVHRPCPPQMILASVEPPLGDANQPDRSYPASQQLSERFCFARNPELRCLFGGFFATPSKFRQRRL